MASGRSRKGLLEKYQSIIESLNLTFVLRGVSWQNEKKLKDNEKLGNTSCYLMELHNIFHNICNKLLIDHICMLFLAFLYCKYSSHEHNFVNNVFPFKSILFLKEFLSSQQN